MAESIKKIVNLNVELTKEERNLFSTAFKNKIGIRRSNWRTICSIQKKENEKNGNEFKLNIISNYKLKIEKEIEEICNNVLLLLHHHLIPFSSNTPESKVFFYKKLN